MNSEISDININAIGVMSGTSLDGLDICFANFIYNKKRWTYKILAAESEAYPEELKRRLACAHLENGLSLIKLHFDYGAYIGQKVKSFIVKNSLTPDLIASHGHTIFHQPQNKLTFQIGSGACIAAETGLDIICDFRSTDVALSGQGAPLVPVGDQYLFSEYDYCLNLGGFSNISFQENEKRIAYDICPVNFILNHYAKFFGKDFDQDGMFAASGNINKKLLDELNKIDIYIKSGPKSLAREEVEKIFLPIIDSYKISTEDKLATYCEHISIQIRRNIKKGKVLVTGGGAFNSHLISRMHANSPQCVYYIPDAQTINFKEALLFAFLGVLFIHYIPNSLSSVTGSKHDNIGGSLYKGIK